MYAPPTLSDFQRNLDDLIHRAERDARATTSTTLSEFVSRGTGRSTMLIRATADRLDPLHRATVERAMALIDDCARRNPGLTPVELAQSARSRLGSFATMLLGSIPAAGFHEVEQRVRAECEAVFRQRLDGALRDIEIGFIGGRDVATTGPVIFNNIKIDNSVVGAINTGNVKSIDVSLTNLHNAGRDDASAALKSLTEAILGEASMDITLKNEMVEQVAFLSEEATRRPEDRKPGMIKTALGAISQGAGTVVSVSQAWQAAEPIIRSIFGS
jgi:hypothetical protein